MRRKKRLLAVLLAGLMVASVATVGGAALGQSTIPADATNSAQPTQQSVQTTPTNSSNDSDSSNETDGWPAPRADAGRTGATSDDGPLPYANTSWTVASYDWRNTWLPVVTGDTVVRAYAGDDYPNGRVEAYNASTGDVRWEQTNVGEPIGPATIDDGRVFLSAITVVTDLPGANRTGLYALNATTGEIVWRVNDTRSAPVVAGDRVFTSHQSGQVFSDEQSEYGNVTAHDATTGERVWTSDVQGQVVASADGRVFVTDEQSKTLAALDATDGSLLWRTTVGEDYYFERIDSLGETNYFEGELAATDDALYLTIGFAPWRDLGELDVENATARVSAYAADDGAKLWEQNITTESGTTPASLSAPAVANGTVYVGGGGTHALDAETGAPQWTFSEASGDPAVANGTVYVGTTYGRVGGPGGAPSLGGMPHLAAFALDASDGTEKWSLLTDILIEGVDRGPYGPAVADGRLYFMFQTSLISNYETTIVTLESQEERPPWFYRVMDVHYTDIPDAEIEVSPPPGEDGYYEANTTVALDASASSDENGKIVSYEWDLDGDGEYEQTGQTIEVTTAGDACEVVTVTLRVTDDEGITDETTVTLQTEP